MKKTWLRPLLRRRLMVSLLLILQVLYLVFLIIDGTRTSQVFTAISTTLSFLIALHILTTSRKGAYKLTWIFLVLAFPIFGGFLYLFICLQASSRRLGRKVSEAELSMRPFYDLAPTFQGEVSVDVLQQVRYLRDTAAFPVYSGCETSFYSPGEALFAAMQEELLKAEKYIFLEYFIVEQGAMWDKILDILKEKARHGVRVRLLYDDVGCFFLLPKEYPRELSQYGIECHVFNPFVPFLSVSQNNRDHRKICVIDGKTAFTGGVNLADEYINAYDKHGHWKDAGLMIRGSAAWSFTLLFLTMWQVCTKAKEDPAVFCPAGFPEPIENGLVLPYADSPMDKENVGEQVYLQMIHNAKHYLYITTPYLIIDDSMAEALCLAAKSGVDVRIMTPQRWDKKLVHMTTRSYYRELLAAGVKIYEYTGGFVHAKCFVSDDTTATVGTVNMDFRSLYLHFECGAWLYRTRAVLSVRDDFLETLPRCTPITLETFRTGFFQRIFQNLLRLLSPLM